MRCCICNARIGSKRLSTQLFPEDPSKIICTECALERQDLITGNAEQKQEAREYFTNNLTKRKQDPAARQYVADLIRICAPETGRTRERWKMPSFRLRHA